MENSSLEPPGGGAGLLNLGVALGESSAFGRVAGSFSAAQAASLDRIREEKLFKTVEPLWDDFCPNYLKMSRAEADRIIRLWQEFGPGYFEMAQLTRISPETYRAIAPSVKDGALHVAGEAIPLNPGNSRKVAAAVAGFRRTVSSKKPPRQLEPHQRIADLETRCTAIVLEFDDLSRRERCGENWIFFTAALERLRTALARIAKENGLE